MRVIDKIEEKGGVDMASIHVHTDRFGTGIFQDSVSTGQKAEVKKESAQEHEGGKNIFVGDSPILFSEQMGQKKAAAQKNSLKKILEQFTSDLEVDNAIKDSEVQREELTKEIEKYNEELNKIEQAQKELKEEYGITDGCEEEENLELLRKSVNDLFSLTEEDMTKLEEMGEITDYQKAALEYDAQAAVWEEWKADVMGKVENTGKQIEAIKLERLKADPMVAVQAAAAEIMEVAIQNIITEIYEEAKEELEEKFGGGTSTDEVKKEEVAEEKDEKVEEEQVDVEKIQEELTSAQKDILGRFKKFILANGMLPEDVLGIKIDELL